MASYDRPRDQRIDPAFILATAITMAAALAVAIIAIIFAGTSNRVGAVDGDGITVSVVPPPTTERRPTQVPVP